MRKTSGDRRHEIPEVIPEPSSGAGRENASRYSFKTTKRYFVLCNVYSLTVNTSPAL
jgi:hypothetical protein